MKVCVFGANGQIGQHLVKLIQNSSKHTVRAVVRKQEQVDQFQQEGIEAMIVDLEDTVVEISKVMDGCDAVIFTAGSGAKTGPDKTLLVDLDGAVKTMEAAKKTGINRYIMVSAIQAHHRANWSKKIKPYFVAKHYADRMLVQSGLTYTIVRPGGLTNETATGKVTVAENLERHTIPREDVAKTVLLALDESNTFNREFDLVSGESPIETALKNL
ncbi:SDR family oxidoreductase [Salirhabdus salicampi]|uniref:SDR family oxidoreductase n=1 Tax=Salirhabdus salicampi TaxID=476102 RepID=UPI0020C5320E|nr:SDR family oxidoreductase [Salirhabdus salicampi]MCP8616207.1 SDR family oxidoreductase [Salirhabdus salicampi]